MPIRFRLYTALIAAALAFPAFAQQPQQLTTIPKQDLDIIKVILAQEAAWNRGDLNGFSEAYKDSPDTLFITNAVNRGFQGMVEAYHRDYPNKAAMGTLSFSGLEVHGLDEKFAVCIGK